MDWRGIKTDAQAKEVAKKLGVILERASGVWVASSAGRIYWASRPMYAFREWLRWQ